MNWLRYIYLSGAVAYIHRNIYIYMYRGTHLFDRVGHVSSGHVRYWQRYSFFFEFFFFLADNRNKIIKWKETKLEGVAVMCVSWECYVAGPGISGYNNIIYIYIIHMHRNSGVVVRWWWGRAIVPRTYSQF